MNRRSVMIAAAIAVILGMVTWKSCRYAWNPHYAANEAVCMGNKLYNADSSAAVVNYTLDIGARGIADYKTLLRTRDYQGDLAKFMLPVEYIEPKWRGLDTLEVIYNEAEAFLRGGNTTSIQKEKDIVTLNGIVITIKERRMNKQQTIQNYINNMKRYAK